MNAIDYPTTPTLSVRQAAKVLGVGKTTAYEMARRGDLDTIRIGARVVVLTESVRRLLRANEEPAA